MKDENLYEYAVIRYVPRVEREEFINVGLIMMCKRRKWLKARVIVPQEKLHLYNPAHSPEEIAQALSLYTQLCDGELKHPACSWPVEERFRWLTAVKSSCISTSRPHPGLAENHETEFNRLFTELVE